MLQRLRRKLQLPRRKLMPRLRQLRAVMLAKDNHSNSNLRSSKNRSSKTTSRRLKRLAVPKVVTSSRNKTKASKRTRTNKDRRKFPTSTSMSAHKTRRKRQFLSSNQLKTKERWTRMQQSLHPIMYSATAELRSTHEYLSLSTSFKATFWSTLTRFASPRCKRSKSSWPSIVSQETRLSLSRKARCVASCYTSR